MRPDPMNGNVLPPSSTISSRLLTYFIPLTLLAAVSPTKDGLSLDCCGTPAKRECSKNPKCAKLGLDGLCCDTVDGVFLDCCAAAPNTCQEPNSCDTSPSEASCELNQQCDDLGLEGVCWYVSPMHRIASVTKQLMAHSPSHASSAPQKMV